MATNLHTTHYRFGIDQLAESTHGWHANEDANPAQGVIAVDTTFLLRFTVQETGGTQALNTDNQFQVAKNGGAFQNITTSSTIVKAVAAVAFNEADNCTKRLSGTGTFESSGAGCTEDGLSGGNANDIAASGNSETECGLQIVSANVAHGDVLTFKLTSPDFTITNDVVPTLTVDKPTIVEADGAASGVASTVAAIGLAFWLTVGASVGIGTALGDGQDAGGPTIIEADGACDGVATATGVSGATAGVAGASNGLASIDGLSTALWTVSGTADGVAAATGLSGATWPALGASDGLALVAGVGENAASGGGQSHLRKHVQHVTLMVG